MKKIIRYFSFAIISMFFMFMVVSNPVEANYDESKNTIGVSVSKKEGIKITLRYQRGVKLTDDIGGAYYTWCEGKAFENNDNSLQCTNGNPIYLPYSENGIAIGDALEADKKLTQLTFSFGDDNFLKSDSSLDKEYTLVVAAKFCKVRVVDESTGKPTRDCFIWDDYSYVSKSVNIKKLAEGSEYSFGLENIDDTGMKTLLDEIADIVYNVVLPALWVVIGLVLVVKGTLLGVQIVKAADEPQVRQEKLGSLKWLLIGVVISAAAVTVVQVLMGYMNGAFTLK